MDINEKILDASPARTTPGQVFAFYKERYGEKRWHGKLAEEMVPIANVKKASIMRRFQGKRKSGVSNEQRAQYRTLGESLPPRVPSEGYTFSGTIWLQYSKACEERDIPEGKYFAVGDDATLLLNAALGFNKSDPLQIIANCYNEEAGDTEEPQASVCKQIEDLTIEALGDEDEDEGYDEDGSDEE